MTYIHFWKSSHLIDTIISSLCLNVGKIVDKVDSGGPIWVEKNWKGIFNFFLHFQNHLNFFQNMYNLPVSEMQIEIVSSHYEIAIS